MSAFDDFIQLELPKRPYLDTDVAVETIMVRRGAGPRQLSSVPLTNGQVVSMVNGVITGVAASAVAPPIRKSILVVTTASSLWTIAHNLNSTNAIVQIVDGAGLVMFPDAISFVDSNTITVSFHSNQAGTARAIFLD